MRKAFAPIGAAIAIISVTFILTADPGGRSGTTLKTGGSGCIGCHGSAVTPTVVGTILGPSSIAPGQTAIYTLVITGGPGTGSGCNIAADSGSLVPLSTYLKLSGAELVQTSSIAYQSGSVGYRFKFTAPLTPGSVKLYATAYSSNRTQSSGVWNFAPTRLITISTPVSAPSVPVVQLPVNGATQVSKNPSFSWNPSSNATSYRIQLSTDAAFTTTVVDSSSVLDTTLTTSTLLSATNYFWRVKAINGVGESDWSASSSFTTISLPDYSAGAFAIIAELTDDPDKVVVVALDTLSAGSVFTMTDNPWVAASGFGSAEGTIEWTLTGKLLPGTVVIFTGGTPWTVTAGTVSSPTAVYPSLSTSGDQMIAFSGTWAAKPTVGSDAKFIWAFSTENFVSAGSSTTSDCPTALANYSTALTTSATEKDNGYFANGTAPQTSVAMIDTKDNLITAFRNGAGKYNQDDNLVTLPSYWFRVGTVSAVPAIPVLAAPANAAANQQVLNMRLLWIRSADADRYRIQLSATSDFSGTILMDSTLADTTVAYKKSILQNSASYSWRVKALNAVGEGEWSAPFSFMTGQIAIRYVENFGAAAALVPGWFAGGTGWSGSISVSSAGLYADASGGANVLAYNSGTAVGTLTYSNMLSTVGFANIVVTYYAKRSASFTPVMTFEWSSDSTVWNAVTYTDALNTNEWIPVTISLPAGAAGAASLRFRWTYTAGGGTTSQTYRIDDLMVKAEIVPTSVETESALPTGIALEQNYPNPFNPNTVISYQSSAVSRVDLRVYDLLGREVATLVNEVQEPGRYSVRFDANGLTSGLYICQLKAGKATQSIKMILMR
jgi:hypothetical protein